MKKCKWVGGLTILHAFSNGLGPRVISCNNKVTFSRRTRCDISLNVLSIHLYTIHEFNKECMEVESEI